MTESQRPVVDPQFDWAVALLHRKLGAVDQAEGFVSPGERGRRCSLPEKGPIS